MFGDHLAGQTIQDASFQPGILVSLFPQNPFCFLQASIGVMFLPGAVFSAKLKGIFLD
jgi:hypothetical protein